jgi:hypothetical protein
MGFLDRFKAKSHEELEAEHQKKEADFRMSLDAEEAKAYDDAYKRQKLERLKRLGEERGKQEYAPRQEPNRSTGQGFRNLAHSMGGIGQSIMPSNARGTQPPHKRRHGHSTSKPSHYVNEGGRLVPVYSKSSSKRRVDRRPKRPQLGNVVLGW